MYNELTQAIDHILAEAQKRGYTIVEMATTGESAGGALAMLLALRYGEDAPIPIRFVMQETGPASFIPEIWSESSDDQTRLDFVNSMTGEKFTLSDLDSSAYQEAIDKISPAAYITEDTLPMLLAYGSQDRVVLPQVKEPLLKALKDHQVKHDLVLFEHSGHSLFNDPEQLLLYRQKMMDYVATYFTSQ